MRWNCFYLVVCLFCSSTIIYGQTIKGVIVEKNTNIPLVGAHIYIINSLQGTVTNTEGKFSLTPTNTYGDLLVTYVGYENKKIEFSPSLNNFRIELVAMANQLDEVSIQSQVDKKWKKLYKKFEASFLGATANAKLCTISNPWVVDVTKGEKGELIAKSIQPIEIINNALGYKLNFHLTEFILKSGRLHYQGFVYFDELEAGTSKQLWMRNRKKTFLGSKRHFITALVDNALEKEGFEVYTADFSPNIGFITKKQQNVSEVVKAKGKLAIPEYLKIVYTNAEPQSAYLKSQQTQTSFAFQGPKADLVSQGNLQMSNQGISYQVSYLYSRNSRLLFTDNGIIINTENIIEYGYWSWLGVAEMLPYEYTVLLD